METMDLGWITLYILLSIAWSALLIQIPFGTAARHFSIHGQCRSLWTLATSGSPPPAGTADQSPIARCLPALRHCPSALIFSHQVLHSPLFYHKFYMPYTYTFR